MCSTTDGADGTYGAAISTARALPATARNPAARHAEYKTCFSKLIWSRLDIQRRAAGRCRQPPNKIGLRMTKKPQNCNSASRRNLFFGAARAATGAFRPYCISRRCTIRGQGRFASQRLRPAFGFSVTPTRQLFRCPGIVLGSGAADQAQELSVSLKLSRRLHSVKGRSWPSAVAGKS